MINDDYDDDMVICYTFNSRLDILDLAYHLNLSWWQTDFIACKINAAVTHPIKLMYEKGFTLMSKWGFRLSNTFVEVWVSVCLSVCLLICSPCNEYGTV